MFNFITEDHRQIADAARSVFDDLSGADTARRQTAKLRIDAAAVGEAMEQLGVFGTASEDAAMWGAQVQTVIAREAGAACLPFPVLEGLAAHSVWMRSETCRETAKLAGRITVPLMDAEGGDSCVETDGTLSGSVRLVPFASTADAVWVRAQRAGVSVLTCVRLSTSGVSNTPRASVEEDYPVHDLQFERAVRVVTLDRIDTGDLAMVALRQRASLLAAAEIAGLCRRMVYMTRDYLVSRTQFGAPLGSNQALKHALADALVKVEAMNAAIDYAAAASDAGAADAESAICAAKLYSGRNGKSIADSMLQLHGAIGYTMEFPLQLLMRRVYRLNAVHGSARHQAASLYRAFSLL